MNDASDRRKMGLEALNSVLVPLVLRGYTLDQVEDVRNGAGRNRLVARG